MNSSLVEIREIIEMYIKEPYSSLLMGITYGVPVHITKEMTNQIVKSGLTHIIVLSGANITALLFLVEELYKYIGKKIGLLVYFLFLSWFISIVGLEPPLFRAFIMYLCGYVCITSGRPVYKLWNLLLSIWFIAMIKPEWIYSRSLHLSVMATVGLIIGGRLSRRFFPKQSSFVRDSVSSLFVFITTLPLTILYFHSIALISPFATILVSLFVSPLMICGLFLPLFHIIFPPLAFLLAIPTQVMLVAIEYIIKHASSIPNTYIQW